MRIKQIRILMGVLLCAGCILITGCSGIIKPQMGESVTIAEETENGESMQEEGAEAGAGEGIEMPEGAAPFGQDQQENEPRPEMTGTVVHKFESVQTVEDSRGGKNELRAVAELYNEENGDGKTALISVSLGDSETYTTGTWTEENGSYSVAVDEFTIYTSRKVEGVETLVGILYNFGMSGKGTVDIPLSE